MTNLRVLDPERALAYDRTYRAKNKALVLESAKAWRERNPEKVKAIAAAYRKANPDKVRAAVKKASKAWKAANHEKVKAYRAAWYAANSERARATSAAWYAANPTKRRAASAAWYVRNVEKKRAYNATFISANLEAFRIYNQNRRARLRANGGKLSHGLAAKLFELQKGKCPCCGHALGKDYHLDHKMPLSLGGANEDWNMQLLRQRCNSQKRAQHPVDFMRRRGFLL